MPTATVLNCLCSTKTGFKRKFLSAAVTLLAISSLSVPAGATTTVVDAKRVVNKFDDDIKTDDISVEGGTLEVNNVVLTMVPGKKIVLKSSGEITGTGAVAAGTITLESGVVSAVITGGTAMTKDGDGTVYLTNANDFTGTTTITSGTLSVEHNQALSRSGSIAVTGADATLSVAAGVVMAVAGNVVLDGGTITGKMGASIAAKSITLQSGTLDITVTGTGSLRKTGDESFSLTGANDFTGDTTIEGGRLLIKNKDALSKSGTIMVTGAGSVLEIDNGIKMVTTGDIVLNSGTIAGGPGASISAGSLTLETGVVSASIVDSGAVTKKTDGTVTLSAANNFKSGLTIEAGTLIAAAAYSLGTKSGKIDGVEPGIETGVVTLSGGTLQLSNKDAAAGAELNMAGGALSFDTLRAAAVGGLSGATGIVLENRSGRDVLLTVGLNDKDSTYEGSFSGSGGLLKDGSGKLTLTQAGTFTGDTTIKKGTLRIAHNDALSKSGTITVTGAGSVLEIADDIKMVTTGDIVLKSGTIAGGSGASISAGSLTLEDGTVSASIVDSGLVTKTTAGTVTLSAANNFKSGLTIEEGTLIADAAYSLGTKSGKIDGVEPGIETGVVTLSGGTLQLSHKDAAAGAELNLAGGTLSFGTLTKAAVGGLSGAMRIVLENRNDQAVSLTVGLNDKDSTYDGVLSGTGSLRKTGDERFSLTGANDFTGDTTIEGGRLLIKNKDALSQSGTITVTGAGSVLEIADGIEMVTTGDIVLKSGTIAGGSGATISARSFTLENGVVSALIVGSGGLLKAGDGELTLTGKNTFSGGTTIEAGTLTMDSETALGTGEVSVGGGTLKITNSGKFENGLTVTGGTVETGASGTITATAAQISIGGSGVLSPGGNSVGALDITGNLSFSDSGTLRVDISASTHDQVNVTGGTDFSGGYIKIGEGSAVPAFGTKYTIITTGTGIDGIPTVIGENGSNYTKRSGYVIPIAYRFGLSDDKKDGFLYAGYDYASESFLSRLNANEIAVANALNDIAIRKTYGADNTPDVLLEALNGLKSLSALTDAYDSLMPVNMMTVSRSLTKQANALTNNFDRRTRSMRRGSILPGSVWTNYLFTDSYGFDYSAHPLVASNDDRIPYLGLGEESPITLWLNGGGSYWKGKADGFSPTTKSTQYAANIGIDYTWQSGFGAKTAVYSLGLLAGYSYITDKIGGNSSKNELGATSLGIYGSVYYNGFFGNALASYALNSYDFKRDINIGTLKQTATASPDGGQYLGYINAGYEWEYRNWMHGPIVSLQYSNSNVDGYTETGAGNQDLSVDKQTFDSLVAAIGWRVSTRIETETATWLPEVRVSYNHEFLNDGGAITSSMQNPNANPFTVRTADAGRDYVNVGLGVTVLLSATISVSLDYDASLFQKNSDPQHTINAMMRISF